MNFSKRDIFIKSWYTTMKNIGLWIFTMLFIFCFSIIISKIQEKLLDDITAQTILFTIAAFLFQAGINLGILKMALNIHNNNKAEFNQIFGSFHMLIAYILSTIVFIMLLLFAASPGIILLIIFSSSSLDSISRMGGISDARFISSILLLLIPTVYASIRLQFYDYFLVDEECGAVDAIKKSINATKDYASELFIIGAILSTIILISMIPLMIGLIISIPLATMVNTRVYLMLKRTH